LEGDAFRQAIYALDNKLTTDIQYHCLLQLENALAGFCHWALLQGLSIRPTTQTLQCYGQYLQEFKHYVTHHDNKQTHQQLDVLKANGYPDELAQKMVLFASLTDFPLLVALAKETKADFVAIFTLFKEITEYLTLQDIGEQLATMHPHDFWEQKVLTDLQAEIKRIVGVLAKKIVLSKTFSCALYFEEPAEQQKLAHYRHTAQAIKNTLPINLIPYIALTKELEKLIN
jgi:glutamate dehydrogenase